MNNTTLARGILCVSKRFGLIHILASGVYLQHQPYKTKALIINTLSIQNGRESNRISEKKDNCFII